MQGNRDKGRYGFLVVWMGMEFDAIGKDAPHVEAHITGVFVLSSTNASTHVTQIDRVFDNLFVACGKLQVEIIFLDNARAR